MGGSFCSDTCRKAYADSFRLGLSEPTTTDAGRCIRCGKALDTLFARPNPDELKGMEVLDHRPGSFLAVKREATDWPTHPLDVTERVASELGLELDPDRVAEMRAICDAPVLTLKEIRDLRALHAEATPGPWVWNHVGDDLNADAPYDDTHHGSVGIFVVADNGDCDCELCVNVVNGPLVAKLFNVAPALFDAAERDARRSESPAGHWSTTPPTREGFYFVRRNGESYVVHVEEWHRLIVKMPGGNDLETLERVEGWEWFSEPIAEPPA